jgi:hypothetical protein
MTALVASVFENAPRLLYLSDIPPEDRPGTQPLYRLFLTYPQDRLLFLSGNTYRHTPEASIPSLNQRTIRIAGIPRLLFSRFRRTYAKWLYQTVPYSTYLVDRDVGHFRPEALATVAHGYSWLLADAVAQSHALPLHLFVFDDFVRQSGLWEVDRGWASKQFGDIYCRAAVRWCISEPMAEAFRKLYGVDAEVFYPPRAAELVAFSEPPARARGYGQAITFGFAGSLNYSPYGRMLGSLAEVLDKSGHRLVVFGGHSSEVAARHGFDRNNVTLRPMLQAQDIPFRLREEVDVLFAPMAFEDEYRHDMEISFPSKLADYTAAGLPILIWGPTYCSAVRWANRNADSAYVVANHSTAALRAGIEALTKTPGLLERLALGAIAAGNLNFDPLRVQDLFYKQLSRSLNSA